MPLTTPPDTPGALSMNLVSAVLLPDGQWHQVAQGSLFVFYDPQFINPVTGLPVVMGGPWAQFADAQGNTFGCPMTEVKAVQWTLPPPPAP